MSRGENNSNDELAEQYPSLSVCKADIECTAEALVVVYENGGKLLAIGNSERAAYKCDCDCRKREFRMSYFAIRYLL